MNQNSSKGARARRGAGDKPQRNRADDVKKPQDLGYSLIKFSPLNFSMFSMGVVKLATCFRII
jgi:hypothetical protein